MDASEDLKTGAEEPDRVRRRVVLDFPGPLLDKPVIWNLSTRHGLIFNILRASIDDGHGYLVLEIEGAAPNYRDGLHYLQDLGVAVERLSERIKHDRNRCTECGACLGICPTTSFTRDEETMGVRFEGADCIACGLCVKACPARAISLELDTHAR